MAVVVLLSSLLLAAPAKGLRAELFAVLAFVLLSGTARATSLREEALAPTQPSM